MAFPEPIQRSTRPSTPTNGMENNQIPLSQKSNHVCSIAKHLLFLLNKL